MKFKGNIIITDPCYICKKDDWRKCEYGESMGNLGIETYICRDTLYGDWSCTTFDTDTKVELGKFCADAGMVAVFLLDEVLKYNPEFDYHIKRPWTTTLIKDFDGEIKFDVIHKEGVYEDDSVQVIGIGNVNFIGRQAGF